METKRKTCGNCRHANQGTEDIQEGLWACPWIGGTTFDATCFIKFKDTGDYVFEEFDGTNCTWGTSDSALRGIPKGYENREVRLLYWVSVLEFVEKNVFYFALLGVLLSILAVRWK